MNPHPPSPRTAAPIDDERLMRLLDGELESEDAAALRRRLEEDSDARARFASLEAVREIVRRNTDVDRSLDGLSDSIMAAIEADDRRRSLRERLVPTGASKGASNDNARSIFAIASLAAAAAAALFVWSHAQPGELERAGAPLPADARLAAEMPADLGSPEALAPAAAPTSDEATVEVASVDFGAQQGSVFYVPGDGAATAVVWINDSGEAP